MGKMPLLDPEAVQEGMRLESLPDQVYQIIHKQILSGRLRPGVWLRQRDLARELGTSVSTVREALKRLAAESFVVIEPYKGFRTAIPTPEYMADHGDVLCALEQLAFALAASTLTAEDLHSMRQLLDETVYEAGDAVTEVMAADRRFHEIVWRATKRPHLIRLLEQTWDKYHSFPFLHYDDEEFSIWSHNSRTYNNRVLETLGARDARRVRQTCAEMWEADMQLDRRAFSRLAKYDSSESEGDEE